MAENAKTGVEVTDELLENLRKNPGYRELAGRLRAAVVTLEMIPQIKLFMLKEKGLGQGDHSRREEFTRELRFQLVNRLMVEAQKDDLGPEERLFLMIMVEDIAGALVAEYLEGK